MSKKRCENPECGKHPSSRDIDCYGTEKLTKYKGKFLCSRCLLGMYGTEEQQHAAAKVRFLDNTRTATALDNF